MPAKNIITPILSDKYYHIFNRGNNFENIFLCQEDYFYFLFRLKFYISKRCKIYSYALLPNHYHLIVQINHNDNGSFSKQFKLLIQEYTNKINYRDFRSGNLFLKPFRRLEITSDEYFKLLVFYIHYNCVKHKKHENFKSYPFSSYQEIISNKENIISKKDLFEMFGSETNFHHYHDYLHQEKQLRN